jgi:hypothetical protein
MAVVVVVVVGGGGREREEIREVPTFGNQIGKV